MSAEQPRNELGQFAAPGMPPEGGVVTDPQGADEPKYKVTVDGEEREVTMSEALAGYMRQETFTKRSQERERLFEQREAALRAGLQPGLGTPAPQSYPPVAPNSGGWPAGSGGTPPAYEQPAYRTTAQYAPPPPPGYPSYALDGELEDYTRAALQQVTQQMAQMQGQLLQERQAREQLAHEQMEQARVSELGRRYQGFDPNACEAEYYSMSPMEQQKYAGVPRSYLYELMHLRRQTRATPVSAAAPTTPGTSPTVEPPPEAGAARGAAPGRPPLEPPSGSDLGEIAAFMERAQQEGIAGA